MSLFTYVSDYNPLVKGKAGPLNTACSLVKLRAFVLMISEMLPP